MVWNKTYGERREKVIKKDRKIEKRKEREKIKEEF